MRNENYDWKRFWCPRGGIINLSDGGFLYNPDSEYSYYISQDVLPFEKLVEEPCLILLGEPGIGKSTEMQNAINTTKTSVELTNEQIFYLNLDQYSDETRLIKELFETSPLSKSKTDGTKFFIFLDSLDECKLRIDTVSEILSAKFKDYYHDKLYLRIACRTAEWSRYLESNLEKIWNERTVKIYELAPLRRYDVETALKTKDIPLQPFFDKIYERDIQPLAMKPVTLNFLLTIFCKTHDFPDTRKELYENGITLLIDEQNPKRKESKHKSNFTVIQKLLTAERIAALMIYCNKSTILINSSIAETKQNDLSWEEIIGGKEISNSEEIAIDIALINDVIATGLFTLRDKDRMGWAHQTYAEFLAARFLCRNNLQSDQIFSLILNSFNDEYKIIPQLNETVGWLVTFVPSLFGKLMDIDPEVLLKSDVTLHDDVDKERLVDNLLTLFHEQKLYDLNYSFKEYYHKLKHPRLPDQLRLFINDKSKNRFVREEAIYIAEACKLLELQDDLVKLFGDKSDSLGTRRNACRALFRIADDEHKKIMRHFLFEDLADDFNDELKGMLLKILWPKYLSAKELFSLLEKPKDFGTYVDFIQYHCFEYINVNDLPYALNWIAHQESTSTEDMYYLEELIDAIMYMGWQNLETQNVLQHYVHAIKHLLKDCREVISRKDSQPFYKELAVMDSKRRLLIKSVFDSLVEPLKEFDLFLGISLPIVLPKDFKWLLDQIYLEKDETKRQAWARLASIHFDIKDADSRDDLILSANSDQIIFEEFRYYLEPIELDSEKALKEKEHYIKYFRPKNFEGKRALFKLEQQTKVIKLINDLKEQKKDAYWLLLFELCKDPEQKKHFSESHSDITYLPGWKNLELEQQKLILEASKEYLATADPQNDEWLAYDIFYRPAIAGYKAIRLLTNNDMEFIENLGADIWRKWAATIVAFPISYGFEDDPYHDVLLSFVYKKVPENILNAFKIILDKETTKDENIYITKRFEKCWDERISEIVFEKIKFKDIRPNCFSSLFRDLLKNKYKPAEEYFIKLLTDPLPSDKEEVKKICLGCRELIYNCKTLHWQLIWVLIKNSSNFGMEFIEYLSMNRYEGKNFLDSFLDIEIAELFVWIVKHFPYSEDNFEKGAHFVGSREEVGYFRDNLITLLKARGNIDSKNALEYIKKELPHLEWLNRVLYETKVISIIKTWAPPNPRDLLTLASNHNKRTIKNGNELILLVIESLKRLEVEMLGETPTVLQIWNSSPSEITPKDENSLSDFVKSFLKRDLENVIVNREVEIRKTRGEVAGEKPDILITTFKTDSDKSKIEQISMIIETKGCWNNKLKLSMETQLLNRYLKDNQCKYGLYLVGWYLCDSWEKTDPRLKKTQNLKMDLQEIKNYLDQQALSLSQNGITIKSFVLDCRIT